MRTLFHFGDSYGTIDTTIESNKHFCNHIADCLQAHYICYAVGGYSNEIVFNTILDNMNFFKKNDIIFINFSFFSRGCYYDEDRKKIKSTNYLYNEIRNDRLFNNKLDKNLINLVEYYIENHIDYNFRLFKLINSTFNYLQKKGINIFYIFIENSDYSNNLLNFGTQINFENGFHKWLIKNNFHLNQDVHYTRGIQKMLSDVILRKTNNLEPAVDTKCVEIKINDIDKSKIEKSSKII